MMLFSFIALALGLVICAFFQQPSFGQSPRGSRLKRIEQSPNYENGSFKNQINTPVMAEGVTGWKMMRQFMQHHPNVTPSEPIQSVKPDFNRQPQDSEVEIIWLGHSSYLITCGGKRILVDPIFSEYASPVQFTGVRRFKGSQPFTANDLPTIDLIIITHDHYDHLDYNTIKALHQRTARFLMPLGVGQHLERWGVDTTKITELDWWEHYNLDTTIRLTATPSRHFSGRGLSKNKTLWASFVLETTQKKLFLSGDGGYGPHFKEIGQKFGPFDIALIESGQFNDYWPYIHLHPHQTVQAAIDLKAKTLLPIHWGKFKLAMHPWNGPIEEIVSLAEKANIATATPRIGQTVEVSNSLPCEKWYTSFSKP